MPPFPSPAADDRHPRLNLNDLVVHKEATFFVRMRSTAMEPQIYRGDVLIIDRALDPLSGQVIMAIVGEEMMVRRLYHDSGHLWLIAENTAFRRMEVFPDTFQIWGVVTYCIHKLVAPTRRTTPGR